MNVNLGSVVTATTMNLAENGNNSAYSQATVNVNAGGTLTTTHHESIIRRL